MLPTPCQVIGDAHLGVASPDAERSLLRVIRDVPDGSRSLVIMGDLFDFWFAWRHAMPRTGFRVLAALADLHDAGIPVLWIGGNHDCWGGEALRAETGADYTLEPWQGQIGAWRVLLAHGDGLREVEDAPYRRLRRVLRHPLAIRAFGMLHPNLASRVALASSHTSRTRRAGDEGRGLLAVGSRALSATDGPELVIHGHSHVPMLVRAGRGWYGNAGAWYLDQQYLRIEDDRITRRAWSASGEHVVLDVGERPVEAPPPA
ncbi:MAG: UDP-2,3-diacylglucosamine diphosphatase [Gemmatimonadota bacterium]|nr:UDP-2,3-diacylglucosamine diphosphatase [Gemmatimonadota bacterium]MDQ8168370.1 UDP-2,3-diacylglucosamine diphosphatase [Gemmatimonadota bacterium]MDQ8173051.1 UDP-2,3-diacylglucosamine diphosphatase [Gemmatimonadota bacterium]